MKLINIVSLVLPFIGLAFFALFYFADSHTNKKRRKAFLFMTVLSGLALAAIFLARLITALNK